MENNCGMENTHGMDTACGVESCACDCCDQAPDDKFMTTRLLRVIISAALAATGIILSKSNGAAALAAFIAAYAIAGGDVVLMAFRNILHGRVFDENFLMSVATIGAFLIGEYPEGAAVMIFYQIGEFFQGRAVGKSRKSITALMDIRPDYANVMRDGALMKVDPYEVRAGDAIVIKAGERIPLDSLVTDGHSMIDASALTGESIPRGVSPGDEVLSGCVNINGLITATVMREFGESTVNKILDLVENASAKKAKTENFITKFARYYTPAVVLLAAVISIAPPALIPGADFFAWIYRGLVFLVISCPCALVLSIPLSFFGGIGGASKMGVLIKGGNYLEALAEAEIVVFDKTGTLTRGVFEVQETHAADMETDRLLELAACAESCSNHPISVSLKKKYGREIENGRVRDAYEIPGYGVSAVVDDKAILAGNAKLMEKMNIPCIGGETAGTVVHVAVDMAYAGYIVIADEIKADSRKAIADLKAAKIHKTAMLTGDAENVADKVASDLGIDIVCAGLLPGGKVEKLEEMLRLKSPKGKLVFVGDGINDAPVLARSDVGIAMGGLGADAAIEAADVVIMTDEPSKIAVAIKISKRTLRIVKQNIVFALGVKSAVLILAAAGFASMWAGVLADVGVALIAVLNATRGLNVKGL